MADVPDPRTDRHPDTGAGPAPYPTPGGQPEKAPGGVGTGTKDDPGKESPPKQ